MKTNQAPAVLYKDIRFWLVTIMTVLLVVLLLATYPA